MWLLTRFSVWQQGRSGSTRTVPPPPVFLFFFFGSCFIQAELMQPRPCGVPVSPVLPIVGLVGMNEQVCYVGVA